MTAARPDVSVVIVSYNAMEWLPSCLAAVEAAHRPGLTVETVVVDNNSSALHLSSFQMERYLDAADAALAVAVANGPQPPVIKKRYSMKDERHVKVTTERVFLPLDDALVFFSSSAWQGVTVGQFYPPDRGRYRFRVSASGYQSNGTRRRQDSAEQADRFESRIFAPLFGAFSRAFDEYFRNSQPVLGLVGLAFDMRSLDLVRARVNPQLKAFTHLQAQRRTGRNRESAGRFINQYDRHLGAVDQNDGPVMARLDLKPPHLSPFTGTQTGWPGLMATRS